MLTNFNKGNVLVTSCFSKVEIIKSLKLAYYR